VHQIVEAHGGRVDVRSSEEGGTGFVVTLPRVTAAAAVTIAARQR
jgi:signal transduction histidine kinase